MPMAGLAGILSGISVGAAVGSSGIFSGDKTPDVPPMPKAPTVEDAALSADKKVRAKKAAISRSQSIFTSPLGISDQASTAKKTLLGQ